MAEALVVVEAEMLADVPIEILLAVVLHLALLAGEIALPHGTAHARLATWEMTSGRYRGFFLAGGGCFLLVLGGAWLAPLGAGGVALAAVAALAGLLAHEHAYVQAGQSVPLA